MIEKVNQITKDPIAAAHEDEERLLYEEIQELEKSKNAGTPNSTPNVSAREEDKDGKEEENLDANDKVLKETEVLENTLSKIGGLMAVGYGEAGSKIIAQNMK